MMWGRGEEGPRMFSSTSLVRMEVAPPPTDDNTLEVRQTLWMCIDCPVLSHPSFQHSAKCFRSSTLVSNISSLPLLIKNLQLLWTPPALILQKWQVVSSSSALIVVGTKNNIVTHSFIKYLLQTRQPMWKHWASSTGVQSHKMPWLPSSRLGYNTNATGRFQEGASAVEYSMELERHFKWRIGQNI